MEPIHMVIYPGGQTTVQYNLLVQPSAYVCVCVPVLKVYVCRCYTYTT